MEEELESKLKADHDWRVWATYLRNSMKLVKKEVGRRCTFLSFSKELAFDKETGRWNPVDVFFARIKNRAGGVDKVLYALPKPVSELVPEDFELLAYNLKNQAYENQQATRA